MHSSNIVLTNIINHQSCLIVCCVSRTSVSSILVSLAGVHEHMRFTQLLDVAEYKWTVQTTSGVSKLTLVHTDYSPCTSGFNVAVAPDMGDGIIPLQCWVPAGLFCPGSVTDIYSIIACFISTLCLTWLHCRNCSLVAALHNMPVSSFWYRQR